MGTELWTQGCPRLMTCTQLPSSLVNVRGKLNVILSFIYYSNFDLLIHLVISVWIYRMCQNGTPIRLICCDTALQDTCLLTEFWKHYNNSVQVITLTIAHRLHLGISIWYQVATGQRAEKIIFIGKPTWAESPVVSIWTLHLGRGSCSKNSDQDRLS